MEGEAAEAGDWPQSEDKSKDKPLPKHQAGTKGVPEAPGCDEGNVDSRWREKVPPSTGDTTAPCQCLGSAERVQGRPSKEMLPRGCPQPMLGHGQPLQTFPQKGPVGLLCIITPRDVPGHPEAPSLGFSCRAGVASAAGCH